MSYVDQFLSMLSADLPDICTDRDLIATLPSVFKTHSTLTRMRAKGEAPSHFSFPPYHYYLKVEILCWLKSRYRTTGELEMVTEKEPSHDAK